MPPKTRKQAESEGEDSGEEEAQVKRKDVYPKHKTQWVFFMTDSLMEHDPNVENKPALCPLKHPKTGKKALFLFSKEDRNIHELIQFKEQFRSWMIGDTVQSDGSVYLTTEVDPLFLVLPYLIQSSESGKYMTLDQIVSDDNYPECRRLPSTAGMADIHLITDMKGPEDLRAYKYDKDKTLSWLKLKAERVSKALEKKDVCVSGARDVDFVKSNVESYTKEELLRYAYGIVSDYLPTDLSSSLREYLGLPATVEKRPSDAANPPSKRQKLEDITPHEDYSKNKKTETSTKATKQSQAQKKLDKVDKKGMKSMMSFFSPKPKT